MRKNRALEKIRAGETAYGIIVGYGSPEIAEYSAHMSLDWTWLDWQHGTWTEATMADALSTFLATETAPLVRVRSHEAWEINKVLDMGAMGVIAPMVNSREEAEAVVRNAKYPPHGNRSGGGARLRLFSENMDNLDYFRNANDEIMVAVMLETVRAMEKAEEIMSVPGVDVVLPGPGDLLLDVQANGGDQRDRDRWIERLVGIGKKLGKAVGYVSYDPKTAGIYAEKGFRFLPVSFDMVLIREGFKNASDSVRV